MLTKRFRLSLPSDGENLALIRELIEKFLEGTPFQRRSFEIKVVISEASSNVIRHAYDKKATSSLITIHGYLNPFFLRISIKDTGKGFVSFEKKREYPGDGGYGVEMMRRLSDRFMYTTAPGLGTTVEVLFYRPLMPTVLRRPKIAFMAAASILVLAIIGSASLSALPGSPLYVFRDVAEDLLLEMPISGVEKANLAIGFIENHLDDYERLRKEGKFDLLGESVRSAPHHIAVLDGELRKISIADRGRLKWKIRKLNKKATELSAALDRSGPRSPYLYSERPPANVVLEIANGTSKMLAERAIGGKQI